MAITGIDKEKRDIEEIKDYINHIKKQISEPSYEVSVERDPENEYGLRIIRSVTPISTDNQSVDFWIGRPKWVSREDFIESLEEILEELKEYGRKERKESKRN